MIKIVSIAFVCMYVCARVECKFDTCIYLYVYHNEIYVYQTAYILYNFVIHSFTI